MFYDDADAARAEIGVNSFAASTGYQHGAPLTRADHFSRAFGENAARHRTPIVKYWVYSSYS